MDTTFPRVARSAFVTPKGIPVKLIISLICLVMTSAAVGSGITASFSFNRAPHRALDHHLLLAISEPVQQDASTAVAVHSEKIDQIEKHLEAIDRDRDALRTLQVTLAESEVKNYNELTDRMNVSDAKLSTIYSVGGALVALSSIVQAFVVVSEFLKRRRAVHEHEREQAS